MDIKRAPLLTLTEVALSVDGVYTATTDYLLKNTAGFPRLIFPNGWSGVDGPNDTAYPLRVNFTAGYGAVEDTVPEEFKVAIKQHVAFMFANKGDVKSSGENGIPVESLRTYRSNKIVGTF